MALSGDLSEIDLKTLLGLMESTKGTGKLIVKNDSTTITVYFKNGQPINAEGDKEPVGSIEKLISFEGGTFEFIKSETVPESPLANEIIEAFSRTEDTKEKWRLTKKIFPSKDLTFDLSEVKGEEVKLTGEEWRILSLIREPLTLADIVKASPFGELKTLTTLVSILDKKLIKVTKEVEESLSPEDNVIPVKETGWFAVNAPIYGEQNLQFYKKIDGRKDFETLVKEMHITLKEGREILKYLVSQGKVSLRKKPK